MRAIFYLGVICTGYLSPLGRAADPEEQVPPNIVIELQVVAIPQELAPAMIGEMMDEQKIDAAYARLQDLLTKGTAKLMAWPILTCESGARASSQGLDEVPYADDYSPPTAAFAPDVTEDESAKIQRRLDLTVYAPTPSRFETKGLGLDLEVEPKLSKDGKTIHLEIVPTYVELKGFKEITLKSETGENGGAKTVTVQQPEFDTFRVRTSLTLRPKQRLLLGVYRTNEPANHLKLFLLRVDVKAF